LPLLSFAPVAGSQTPSQPPIALVANASSAVVNADTLAIEREKVAIERDKLNLETKRLDQQGASNYLTAAAIFFSALIGLGTIAYNIRNSSREARLQAKLKAVEVVMSAAGARSAQQRLAIVQRILGRDVDLDILSESVMSGVGFGHDQAIRELLGLVATHPERRAQILAQWQAVFGRTNLSTTIEALQALDDIPPSNVPERQKPPIKGARS
jgi:flagellar biosynthesis/type III secretory pathway M-ring protein FliF/YscJ